MAMGLLVSKGNEGKVYDEILGEILTSLKIMGAKKGRIGEIGKDREEMEWNQENSRLGGALGRLKEISKSKENKEVIIEMERIREKGMFGEKSRLSPDGKIKIDRNQYARRSELFDDKEEDRKRKEKFQEKEHLVEYEMKEMRMELVVLRKEKVRMMMELNREIDISNKKSEEIKILAMLLNKKEKEKEKGQKTP